MKIFSTEIKGITYCFIDSYDFSFGKVYKFANIDKRIFCEKINEQFVEIENQEKLKEIEAFFKVETDVIF